MKTITKGLAIILLWLILIIIGGKATAQIITTVAGGTSGQALGGTNAVAVDSAGNIYVAGGGSNTIQQITPSGTNTFGTGTAGFGGDNGTVFNAMFNDPEGLYVSKSKLYVADTKNRCIRMIDLKTNIITTVANTNLGGTCSVAVDSAGNIYVAGGGANWIKQITPTGTNTFGTDAAGFSGDNGPATAATFNNPTSLFINHSNLYIADHRNKRIRVINLATNIVTTIMGSISIYTSNIVGVAADDGGNVFMATGGYVNLICKVDASGKLTSLAGGNSTGNYTGDGNNAINATLNNPVGLYVSGKDLFIADQKNRAIRKIANSAILPLTLLDFSAIASKQKINLQWHSTAEVNVAGFNIEKSTDAVNFSTIGFVKSAGNSLSNDNAYTFNDDNPAVGVNYYRLKMVDADGAFTYSFITKATIELAGTVSIFPVPATTTVTIKMANTANTTIQINDMLGKTWLQTQVNGSANINVAAWPAGVYFIRFDDGSMTKIMKQ
jgi:hypothetical protein